MNTPPRTVEAVVADLETMAVAGITTPDLKDRTALQVRVLTDELCSLVRRENRRSLAMAWSAWLDLMMSVSQPSAGGKSLLQDVLDLEPGLREEFAAALGIGLHRG